jgi:23S rRNA (pseudouridine1915-N3)-methyltransferase
VKIKFLVIGKTNEKYLEEGIKIFLKRLPHYTSFEYRELKDVKNFSSSEDLKNKESEIFLTQLSKEDFVVLLDEKGEEYSSTAFSEYLNTHRVNSTKSIVFIVGGAFGFAKKLYERSNQKFAMSKMTWSGLFF